MQFSRAALLAVVALALVAASAEAAKKKSPAPAKYTSAVDYVVKSKVFTKLVAAATAADLVTTLSDPKLKATLFLPNDKAFDALIKETKLNLTEVLANKPLLTAVLTHHVHAGEAITNFKAGATVLTTLAKQNITVTKKGNMLSIKDGSGRTVMADNKAIKAGASTIFLIKNVLLPKS